MMDDPRVAGQAGAAGLCHACRHMDVIRSDRGSVFYLCRLSFSDPSFPRYPPIPVVACAGFDRQRLEELTGGGEQGSK